MRGFASTAVPHVCIVCALRTGRQNVVRRQITGYSLPKLPSWRTQTAYLSTDTGAKQLSLPASSLSLDCESLRPSKETFRYVKSNHPRPFGSSSRQSAQNFELQHNQTAVDDVLELDKEQMQKIEAVHRLKRRLSVGLHSFLQSDAGKSSGIQPSLEAVLDVLPPQKIDGDEELVEALKKGFSGQPADKVKHVLTKVAIHRKPAQRLVADRDIKTAMAALGVLKAIEHLSSEVEQAAMIDGQDAEPTSRKKSLVQSLTAAQEVRKASSRKSPQKAKASPQVAIDAASKVVYESLDPCTLQLSPLKVEPNAHVPQLSFDLSRVLFNPGVYQLQDQRSRVFNFDPYLAQPMPISEFNFGALNEYITSSKDTRLLGLATAHNKRYIGSSSSMSAVLCQFHFLISQWREINTVNVTRGFSEERSDFTVISRAPAAIFLRWRNGVYAVDADKEYDEPNVLMSLGKSFEKLLTLERNEFEKWRKTGTAADSNFSDSNPEAYHYSEQGDFLLRSQLDAMDPRLPGTGVFDLKTRAVAGIRMNVRDHETGRGYQIKDRYGNWESFEREYYDMMRSAFLKYSMQVRMGNMDGIFVAYHNIERLFGFQYVPISEMDLILHGQSDPSLGDQEFRISIDLMNKIFDKVTSAYPEQPVRFHFETREATKEESRPFMRVFAEPMTDEMIDEIQVKQDSDIAAYEKRLVGEAIPTESSQVQTLAPVSEMKSTQASSRSTRCSDSTDADPEVLEKVFQQIPAEVQVPAPRPLMAFKVKIVNKVNNTPLLRPEQITSANNWTVDYRIEQIQDELARKEYNYCKNRRMSALRSGLRENHRFQNFLRDLSRSGALWRQEQDEIDAQRYPVTLYPA